jgi:hypothetical protein
MAKPTVSTPAQQNVKLFQRLKTYTMGEKVKTQILQSIATHYGITTEEAFQEVTTDPAECLYEYIPDRALATTVWNLMASADILLEI